MVRNAFYIVSQDIRAPNNKGFMEDYPPLLGGMRSDISHYKFFQAAGNSLS